MLIPVLAEMESFTVVRVPAQFDEHLAKLRGITQLGLYHGKTLWLFTVNDLKSMIFPSMIFALSRGLSDLQAEDNNDATHITQLLSRLPLTMIWSWVNLLAFNVTNQKTPRGVEEDRLNKPWRPIPSKRLTMEAAGALAKFTYPISFLLSCYVGGLAPCVLLTLLGFLYNDLGGDSHWLTRNLLNGAGFMSFAAGALEVTTQSEVGNAYRSHDIYWLTIIGLVVGSTIHSQDMYDQVGDAAAGRKTIPLIMGDNAARYTIVFGLCFWSILCPSFWRASAYGYALTTALGFIVAFRTLLKRTVDEDRTTFKLYNLWLMALYLLPALRLQWRM